MHSWTQVVAADGTDPTRQQMWGWFLGVLPRHRQVQNSATDYSLLVYHGGISGN
jgi:hypothetical protein